MANFNSFTGGLVDSVVANVGSQVAASVGNLGNPNPSSSGWASFSVNSLLGNTIQTTTGYALNAGENYLLSQLGSVMPRGENAQLINSVTSQIASAGISQVAGFVSSSLGGLGGAASTVTTAGLGTMAATSSKSIPSSVTQNLPAADYGGSSYTLEDIVFTLVPANAGAQTAPQPQTPATMGWNVGFDEAAAKSIPSVDALKGATALAGPAQGLNVGGRNFGASYSLGSAPKVKPLPVNF